VQVSSVSVISTVSTTNLYLTDFTSETVSLSTILFSSALISNSLGNLATSSIQNVQDFFTPSLDLYGAQASTIEVSSLTVDAQLSTIGPSQATMQFFNGSANYISTLDAKVGPMFPFDTTTLSRFTVENLSVNRINTSNSTVINTSFFSTIPWFTSQFPFPYWRMNDGGVTPIMIGTNAFGTVTFQRSVSNPRFSFAVVAQNLWQWPTYSTLYLQTTLPNFVSTPTSLEKFYRVGIVNDVLFDSPQLYYSPFFYINVAPDNTITEVNAANGLYFSTLNLRYNAGDFFSIYTDGQGFGLGNIYFSLNGISFFSVSWQDMAFWYSYWDINNPTLLPLPRNNYYFIDYGGTDYLPANISYTGIRFGPTSPAFFGSTIPFTYTDKRRISTVSAIDSIVRINTLLYSSSITVASQISSLILSVDTLSTVGNYSSVSISSMILTSTARFSTLASGNCFLSSLTLASAPFAATATPRLAKRIGSEIQYSTIYPYVPYLTGVDLLNKFNGVPNINQGFMPYYFMTGTLSYNDTLEHLEITCGPKYEPCIAKFDAYTNYGVALAWMVERPQSYSNIYLNLDFTRARASGSLSINGATQVVFDSIVNPQISTLTLRNFDLKRYPMYQDQILGYPAGTPWIQLTYTGDGNTTTSKFPMVTMWVSDKPTSEDDNTSFLDVSGLSDMQKGYLSFTSSVNGINIFNPFNDMSVRRLFYSGSLTRTSDPALKEEIEDADLSRCFNALSNVPLCRYKYIDSYLSTFQLDDVYRLGVLATDVESEFPKSVRRKEGTRVVDMEQLKYAHLGTTKYLMEKVEALTEKLSTLKGLYATLPAKS
jgi:hypothetical protein